MHCLVRNCTKNAQAMHHKGLRMGGRGLQKHLKSSLPCCVLFTISRRLRKNAYIILSRLLPSPSLSLSLIFALHAPSHGTVQSASGGGGAKAAAAPAGGGDAAAGKGTTRSCRPCDPDHADFEENFKITKWVPVGNWAYDTVRRLGRQALASAICVLLSPSLSLALSCARARSVALLSLHFPLVSLSRAQLSLYLSFSRTPSPPSARHPHVLLHKTDSPGRTMQADSSSTGGLCVYPQL